MRPSPSSPTVRRYRRRGRRVRFPVGLLVVVLAALAAVLLPTQRRTVWQGAVHLEQRAFAALLSRGLTPAPVVAATSRPEPTALPGPLAAMSTGGRGHVSRAELAELLTTLWALAPTDVGPHFRDVRTATAGSLAIEAAAGAGDFGDNPGPLFRPALPVTRLYLAQALVDTLSLGAEADLLGQAPPAVRDAAALPKSDWGTVRLVTGLGLLSPVQGAFDPAADVTPAEAESALSLARALTGTALATALGPLSTSITLRVGATILEPGTTTPVSATVHAGELALPIPATFSAVGGVVAGGVFVPTIRQGVATIVARAPDGHAQAVAQIRILAPAAVSAVAAPPAVVAAQSVTLAFAVTAQDGSTVSVDNGRSIRVALKPPTGPVFVAFPRDHNGVALFAYRPSLLGAYTVTAGATGLKGTSVTYQAVPGPIGSLSLLTDRTSVGYGGGLSLSGLVLADGQATHAPPLAVPVDLSAVFQPPNGPPQDLGHWSTQLPATGVLHPAPIASLGPLYGPGTVVIDLTTPGGAFLPSRVTVPVAALGSLSLTPPAHPVTAGSALLTTVTATGVATSPAPVSLTLTAPDGGPLAPMSQVLSRGRAQFLWTPAQAGAYTLTASGSGLPASVATVRVLPGPPSHLVALLGTPFPAPGAPIVLRAFATDVAMNPLVGPSLHLTWRFASARSARWHKAVLASGGALTLESPPAGGDCAVEVALSAPALGLSTPARTLQCERLAGRSSLASGTGMFLSYWVARDNTPATIVHAALTAHLHTLYVEVAVPGTGFWGQPGLDRLLAPAHAAGLAVVAWVPANLYHPALDRAVALSALSYRTPLGQAVDGVASDFEGRLAPDVLTPYLMALRRAAGPDRVVCAIARPPTDVTLPYGLMARYADVLMPMDYWENTETPIAYEGSYRLVAGSVALARAEAPGAAVVPILQGYDAFTYGGAGVYNPGPLAERGGIEGARQAGAQGTAFFQWGTLTPAEWQVVGEAANSAFSPSPANAAPPPGVRVARQARG